MANTSEKTDPHSLRKTQLQLTVAQGIVHAANGRPKLAALDQPGRWESCFFSGVGMCPLRCTDLSLRVGRILQWVVIRRPCAILDLLDLSTDCDHRIAEAVKLCLVFGLSWLHHERVRHWPRHRRRVEAVILKPLRDILLNNTTQAPHL